jgi:hypothetical protein
MKKFFLTAFAGTIMMFVAFFLHGCLKDKVTRTYTILTPVYQSKEVALANIKSSTSQTIESPGKIFIYGNYIFLNEMDKGVHIIDNSNPSNPLIKAFISIPGNVDIAVKGNTLYADMYSDLLSIDITDPLNAKLLKNVANVFPERSYTNGFVANSGKVIVDWIRKDTTVEEKPYNRNWMTIDFAADNGARVTAAIGPKTGMGGSLARFSIVNDYLYAVDNHNLKAVSIIDPSDPKLVNNIFAGFDIETIYPLKDKLFLGSMVGLYIFDISNPANPVGKGTFSHGRACDPVVADDNYAFVTLKEGSRCGPANNELDVVDIKNIAAPVLLKTYALSGPSGLSKDGDLLFICDGAQGLKVFNASNVANISLIKQIGSIEPHDVIAWNNNALVVAKEGLFQYDYSNPGNIKLRSRLTISK